MMIRVLIAHINWTTAVNLLYKRNDMKLLGE